MILFGDRMDYMHSKIQKSSPRFNLKEQLILKSRPHIIAPIFQICLLFLSLIFINVAINNSLVTSQIICIILFLATSCAIILDWAFNLFHLTNKRVIHSQGFLWKNYKSIPLKRIQNVSYRAGILGRIVGFGDITIESAGRINGTIRLRAIPNPDGVVEKIQAAIPF